MSLQHHFNHYSATYNSVLPISGFHEAIGDCIALAVSTPAHLRGLGLIEDEENKIPFPLIKGLPQLPEDVTHQEMNYLLRMALDKIPFLPFAVAMDKWRWKVFDGSINPTEYNGEWWRLVEELQGLLSPTEPQPDDFDPGAKYHIPANVEYIRYFVSFILQFQFYDEMCSASHHTGHLFRCDFNGNLDAGTKLRIMMQKGMSQPWNEALQDMIGNGTMSAASLLKYFAPLHKYLEEINEANDERCIGWECDYEDIAREYMAGTYESEMNDKCSSAGKADWNYNTDINSDNEQLSIEASLEFSAYEKHTWDNFITEFDYENFKNETLKRQFKLKSVLGVAALDKIKLEAAFQLVTEHLKLIKALLHRTNSALLNKVQSNLKNIYSTGKICPYNEKECDLITSGIPLEGEPGETSIEDILESSQNYDELAYVWEAWRDATGKKMFDYFVSYVSLSNDAAQANGLENYGDLWMMPYDMADEFKNQIEKILNQTMPLYEKIHAYARKKLLEKYTGKFAAKDLIPASLFGNMWAQSWEVLYPIVAPYPELPGLDVTDNMVAFEFSRMCITSLTFIGPRDIQLNVVSLRVVSPSVTLTVIPDFSNNWTVEKMFEVSENFYVNLTLEEMPTTYNTSLSMIVKPPNKEVTCHASAWEFCKEEDYRIKMCTGVNMQDLITVHHEMGHIQYFQQYRHAPQPYAFREGANPGFHEAVGDLMALSVQTPGHLKKIGLLEEDFTEDERSDLNFLMLTALSKIVFLPFAYVMDRWRWDIFAGQVEQEQWNKHWWDLRATYQGIMPPVLRTNQDLDAGAKYHTAANVEYSRYFVAHILQFQLHKSLCEIAGQFDENDPNKPLYRCDIDGNAEAGEKIRLLLAAGSSIPWPNLLESIIGERELNASAILLYFKPLSDWLDEQLTDDDIGWDPSRVDDWFLPKELGSDDTVAIIVGSVIAALVLLTLVGYFVGRSRAEKKAKRENEMREAQDYAENNDAYLSDGNNASL
ncbi:hypothetical protein QYM36_009469 [Artemia franciscana]|uniref:Angiotensin-converting enzyme n=1 Tax=Artemia franciscana TaxID=6661 RepID=A0AA88KZT0_ARTSF|nr:hypothetical protein QYM36_009469 [Artemia franciscana]